MKMAVLAKFRITKNIYCMKMPVLAKFRITIYKITEICMQDQITITLSTFICKKAKSRRFYHIFNFKKYLN